MKRDHQLHPQSFTDGEPVDKLLQLGHRRVVFAELELHGEQLLEHADMQLFKAPDLALCEVFVSDVDERRAPPQLQRALECTNLFRAPFATAADEQFLETPRVDLILADREYIGIA